MPIVAADWSINKTTGAIRYIGTDHGVATPSYVTVIEFHRWLQDLADDAVFAGNDEMDITVRTPSERSTDNIITLLDHTAAGGPQWNIDDNTAEHCYDGTIVQKSGAEIYDGFVVIGASPNIQIIQNGVVLVDDWWNASTGLNKDVANGLSHRFMLKVRTASADIDGRRLIATARNFGFEFGEFKINGTARGNNVIALTQSADLNNQTASGTVAGWTDVVNDNQGYVGLDADGNGSNEFYYSNWELGARSKNQFYERMKYLTREGSASTIYGLNGELFRGITHQITVDTPTGTFATPEAVSWAGGTGQILAINSPTAATSMWIQILTGVAPTDNQVLTGGTSAATCLVNITVTERAISTPFIGKSTGSAIIGGYGVGIGSDDLGASDLVTALDNTARTPPNNVTFTVAGVVIGEDRLLVGPETAGGLNRTQFSLQSTLSGAAVTSVVMTAAIPTDTPAAGTIRITDNSGKDVRVVYTSYTGSTFTITSTNFSVTNASAGNGAYVSYIDKLATATSESFTTVFLSSRPLFIRIRDGAGTPIKTFETTGTLSSGGGSTTVIRTSDV